MAMQKRKKARISGSVVKSIDRKYMGEEPIFNGHVSESELGHALNWYNYMHDHKDGKKWLLIYMKNNGYSSSDISFVRESPDWATVTTACWIARIINNGGIVNDNNVQYLHKKIDENISRGKNMKSVSEDVTPKFTVIDQTVNMINDIDSEIDRMIDENSNVFSLYEKMVADNVPSFRAKAILEHYKPEFDEISLALSGKDQEISEGYRFSKKKLKLIEQIYRSIVEDCERYLGNKKAVKTRKPRKIKQKPAEKVVEKVKYKKEDNKLKLVSINPKEILKAKQLWVFNTKYNNIIVYHAKDDNGFGIKGTTILNYDEEKSSGKKLRKPEESLNLFLSSGKIAHRKFLDGLTTKEFKPNSRLNEDTILLKVYT